jgi:hypothetical protein
VDGIVTNRPDLALAAIQERLQKCGRTGIRLPFWNRQPVVPVVTRLRARR